MTADAEERRSRGRPRGRPRRRRSLGAVFARAYAAVLVALAMADPCRLDRAHGRRGRRALAALRAQRPASVLLAFTGVRMRRAEKLFVAWFGPKGIASMLFALFILNSSAPDRTLVVDIAAFVILASIVAHGLTDTVAGGWIERRVR